MDALLYVFLCVIWGSTWLAIKVGLVGVPPFLGAGLRFVISAAVLGVMLALRRQRIRLTRDDKVCILSLGLLVFWLDYAAVYWAELRISSGLTAILFSTMPLTTVLLSRFWTRAETLSRRKMPVRVDQSRDDETVRQPHGARNRRVLESCRARG